MNKRIPQLPAVTPGFDQSNTLVEICVPDISSSTGFTTVKISVADLLAAGGGGGGVYSKSSPSTITVGGLPAGTVLTGLSIEDIIEKILVPYLPPAFTSFAISGQPTLVEVGTIISGPKTFTWAINLGSGTVPTINIYDNTGAVVLLAGTANDGTEAITIPTVAFTAQGQTQSYKGIGNNTAPVGTFNSGNFIITSSYLLFYGATPAAANNSATTRALPSNRFVSLGNTFSMNTGAVEKIFQIAMPATKTLSSVEDVTAGFFITVSFVLSTFNVNDIAGNPVAYKMYTLTNATPYAASHTLNITIV